MEKYSTCCCCRAKIGEAFGKGNVKIQLAVGLLFVFEFIKEIKSALAEGNEHVLPVASHGDRLRSASEKRISKAVFISMLGPRLGAGSAVTTREALVVWGHRADSHLAQGVAGAGTGGCGDFGDTRAVGAQGRKPVIPGDRGLSGRRPCRAGDICCGL